MSKTVETIVKHPIATTIIINCIVRGIATIIEVSRGGNIQPIIMITKNVAGDKTGITVDV